MITTGNRPLARCGLFGTAHKEGNVVKIIIKMAIW